MNIRHSTSVLHVRERGLGVRVEDIVGDRGMEQVLLLGYYAYEVSEIAQSDATDVVLVDGDPALGWVIEPEEQLETGGFSATAFADNGRGGAWFDDE